MADNSISGLYRILPTHPVKKPQPADKEGETGRHKRPPIPPPPSGNEDDDADDKPVIDEYV